MTTPPAGWANAYQFTIGTVPTTALTLVLRLQNNSGDVLANEANVVSVYHVDDESDFLAGEVFQSDFLAAMTGTSIVRCEGGARPNTLGMGGTYGDGLLSSIEFSDFNVETDRTWVFQPWTTNGKLATKLNADLHVTIPPKCSAACVLAIAQAIRTYFPHGLIYVEDGNEWWNTAPPYSYNRDWATTNIVPGISVVDGNGDPSSATDDKIGCAMAEMATRDWAIFEGVFGRDRVRRMLTGQESSYGNGTDAALQYTVANDPALSLYGAVKVGTLVDVLAVAPYIGVSSGGSIMLTKELSDSNAQDWTDNDWTTYFEDYIDNILDPGLTGWEAGRDALAPQARMTCYEGGFGDVVIMQSSAQMHTFTANYANNTIDNAGDISSSFDDGDRIRTGYNVNTLSAVQAGNINNEETWYVKKQGTDKLELYSDSGLTTRCDIAAGADGLTWQFDNYTRLSGIDGNVKTFQEGSSGAAVMAYVYNVLYYGRLECFTFTNVVYPYNIGANYALMENVFDAASARTQWFRDQFAPGGNILRFNRYVYGTTRGDLS